MEESVASSMASLSSFPSLSFLLRNNFIGTLELPAGLAVASPIKARVDHRGTSVLTVDQHEQHREAENLNFLRLGAVGRGRGSEKGRAGVERTAEERREDEAWLGAQLGRSWLRRRWFRRWFWRRLGTWFRRQRTHIHGSRQGSHGHKDRSYSRALPSRGDKTRPCSRQCTSQSTGRQASSCPRASTLPGHSREACALSGREANTLPRKGARQGADKGACAGQGTCQGTGHCTKTSALPCQGALGREGACTCPCARTRWWIRRRRIRRWWIVTGRWTRFRRLRAFLMQRLELGRVSKSLIFNVRQHCPSTAAGQCNC